MLNHVNTPPFSDALKKLTTVVLEGFTGRIPVAAINYHAIYAMCLRIFNEMAVLALQVQDQPVEHGSPASEFKSVETLLVAIVERQRDSIKVKLLPHLASLRLSRRAITKFCEGKTLSEFAWKF